MKFAIDRCHGVWLCSFDLRIGERRFILHLLPRRHWQAWGYAETWYGGEEPGEENTDGPYYEFGLGPFLLFCWAWE